MTTTTTAAGQRADDTEEPAAGGGRKKKLLIIVLVLALLGGAGYWFFLRAPAEAAEPVAGEVVALEPIQVNLADGHYLSLGIALQLVEGAEEVDGSKALDAAIEMFSGRAMAELSQTETRVQLKEELAHELEESYEEEVMGVYLTQFVTQ